MTFPPRLLLGIVSLACLFVGTPATAQEPELVARFDQGLAEFDEAQALQANQPARARQLFRSAAQRFASIAATGVQNGWLECNLANCYLQAGELGRAILHYRKAQRLIPHNPMLEANLKLARDRCLTSIRPTRRSAVLKTFFFWHYQSSVATRTAVGLCAYLALWVILIARNFAPRRALTIMALLCALVSTGTAGSVAAARWTDRNAPEGVVIDMDVVVSKGPGSGYQRQFEQPLQPGVEFTRREKTRSGWWRVELADGKTGWIEEHHAELVPRHAD